MQMEEREERRQDQNAHDGIDERHERPILPVHDVVQQFFLLRREVVPADVEQDVDHPVGLCDDDVPHLVLIGDQHLVYYLDRGRCAAAEKDGEENKHIERGEAKEGGGREGERDNEGEEGDMERKREKHMVGRCRTDGFTENRGYISLV